MRLRRKLKLIAHRRGWIASPTLAFQGVPFGPQNRDLAGEVMQDLARRCEDGTCSVCFPDAPRWTP
jgi:hypothetical protein